MLMNEIEEILQWNKDTPPSFYSFGVCHFCKEPHPALKKCGSCRIVLYCNRDHQISDWDSHKQICKTITKTSPMLGYTIGCSADEFNHFKHSRGKLWLASLKRVFHRDESHMWRFPKVCKVCYSPEVTIVCNSCFCVGYCGKPHEKAHYLEHSVVCEALRLCLLWNKMPFLQIAMAIGCPAILRMSTTVLTLPKSNKVALKMFGMDMRDAFSRDHLNCLIESIPVLNALTLLFALEHSKMMEKRVAKQTRLHIHIVGEYDDSIDWSHVLAFINHWIRNLKELKIVVVEQECNNPKQNHRPCLNCKNSVICDIVETAYPYTSDLEKPDLVVTFNSGLNPIKEFGAREYWDCCLPAMVSAPNVPILLTAHTEEDLLLDIERFQKYGIRYYLKPQKNPYHEIKPFREWREGRFPVYYKNSYLAVITKT